MKILKVVESFGAGVYSFLVDICEELAQENEVVIVYSKRKETPNDFKNDFPESVKFIELDMGLKKIVSASLNLSKIIKEEKPDIVHLHSSKAGAVGRISKVMANYKGRLFYNPHGLSFLREDLSKNKRKILFLMEKALSKLGGHVIGVSKSEWEEIRRFTKNSSYVNNWIDIESFEEKLSFLNAPKEKLINEKLTIGTVGRIEFQKNPKLFNEVAKKFLDINFIWIGEGSLKNELNSKNIKVTGWLSREEVLEKINEFDIYIQTSLWEGLPISVLEAMAMKKPILVSNVIGNKDLIENNGEACKSINDFEHAIENFKNDKSLILELGNKSMSLVSERFDKHISIADYKKKYGIRI